MQLVAGSTLVLFPPSDSVSHPKRKGKEMESKVVVVTGASRGIGKSIAECLAIRGANVVVNYTRNLEAAESTLKGLVTNSPTSAQPLQHSIFKADVANPAECEALINFAVSKYGRLDVLVNNAGICPDHDIFAMSYQQWQQHVGDTMATNFFGASNLSFLAAHQFKRQNDEARGKGLPVSGGRIVNITSRAAYRGELTAAGYAASKAALSILGQSFARRLAPEGILVYTIAPGWVETEMAKDVIHGPQEAEILAQHPLGRVASTEEVGKECAWLALEAPAAMTGSVIDLNGASYLR
jgi:3-oxoacyl-[acyl-carrier protein] reductase